LYCPAIAFSVTAGLAAATLRKAFSRRQELVALAIRAGAFGPAKRLREIQGHKGNDCIMTISNEALDMAA
jgi:hypothetical protein